MAYCTEADIIARMPDEFLEQLTDDTDADSEDTKTARITAAIADADSDIDSYIGTKYNVPLADDDVSQNIKNQSVRIAIYYLASRRSDALDEDSIIKINHDKAIAWLKDVSSGKAILSAPPPEENPDRVGSSNITSDSRVMNHTKLDKLF